MKFIEMLRERGMSTLDEVNAMGTSSVQNVQKMPTYHAIILATCDQGRTNLYKLISLAHIKYYHGVRGFRRVNLSGTGMDF